MASEYQHGHTYDLFLSYSTRDLEWVRQFYDDLVADINRFAERDVYPFLDKVRLQPGYVWNEELLAAASDSAVLVPVLSPRFFQSDYCQKEVRAFIDAFGFSSGAAHRSRIQPVKLLCAAPGDHVLAAVQAASFYKKGDDGVPFEHRPGTPEYKEALRRLAVAIAEVLKTVPSKQQRRPAVYVATDFKPPSEKLRASLEHHFDVLPENPMGLAGLSREELQQSLERDFTRCFASVHPIGDALFAKALIDAQLDFARKQPTIPRLAWTPERPDELTNAGFEWFTSQIEIEERIRHLHDKPIAIKSGGAERLIYFLCPDRGEEDAGRAAARGAREGRRAHLFLAARRAGRPGAADARAGARRAGWLLDLLRRHRSGVVRCGISARAQENPAARFAERGLSRPAAQRA
jgi:hypothetical protein